METAKTTALNIHLYLKGYKRCNTCGDSRAIMIKSDEKFCPCCGGMLGATPSSLAGTRSFRLLAK